MGVVYDNKKSVYSRHCDLKLLLSHEVAKL